MLLDLLRAFKQPGQEFPFEISLTLEPITVLDDPVSFDQVNLSGFMVGAGESASIDASVTAEVHTRCSRCLGDVRYTITAKVDEVFTREIDPDNPDAYPVDGSSVDIDPVVRDALLLELPMRFLCREDCEGLCPVCGKNRNDERCTCLEGAKSENPFAALSELLKENEEV